MIVLDIILFGPIILYIILLIISYKDGSLEAAYKRDAEERQQINNMYSPKEFSNGYSNPQGNNLDEAYLLFMGDAVLRSNHPEAKAAEQSYYNNEHCEAW